MMASVAEPMAAGALEEAATQASVIIVPTDFHVVKRPLPTMQHVSTKNNPDGSNHVSSRDSTRLALHWLATPDVDIRDSSIEAARLLGALTVDNNKLLLRLTQEEDFLTAPICRHLLCLLEANRQATDFLLQLVEQDVAQETATEMLFRRNTPATRLVSAYLRLVGHDFLQASLAPSIQDACNSNPLRKVRLKGGLQATASSTPGPENDTEHFAPLIKACQTITDMIVQNLIRLPEGFRRLTHKLYQCVEARFEGQGAVVIRGFVFLRLLCPALINPHDYDLLDGPPDELHVDTLKTMARLTQHLANSTGTREKLTLPRNIDSPSVQAFINQNRTAMLSFVEALTQPSQTEAIVVPVLGVPLPSLWCCQRCLLVNRRQRQFCLACHLEYFPGPVTSINPLTHAARELSAHVVRFMPALEASSTQSCVTTLKLSAKELLLESMAAFSCASSTMSSPRRHASHLSPVHTRTQKDAASSHLRVDATLAPQEAARLSSAMLENNCSLLCKMLSASSNANSPVHSMLMFAMANGVGLHLLQHMFTTAAQLSSTTATSSPPQSLSPSSSLSFGTASLPSRFWLEACHWEQRLDAVSDILGDHHFDLDAASTPLPLARMAVNGLATYLIVMIDDRARERIAAQLLRKMEADGDDVSVDDAIVAIHQAMLTNNCIGPLLAVLRNVMDTQTATQLIIQQLALVSFVQVCQSSRGLLSPDIHRHQAVRVLSQLHYHTRAEPGKHGHLDVRDGRWYPGPTMALMEMKRMSALLNWEEALYIPTLATLRLWLLALFEQGQLALTEQVEEDHRHGLIDRLRTVLQDGGYIERSCSQSTDQLLRYVCTFVSWNRLTIACSSSHCEADLRHWAATTTMRVASAPESRAEHADSHGSELQRRRASTHNSSFSHQGSLPDANKLEDE
eukprot:TRINITY_DN9205_c0_g1_i4.p1 TRINITY_DN9205_c0_g1~~TRINITY_DN9205_c0_g1_i4.p1  ORF type:complete len:910 (+),score=154.71 TRINITY_DN9205_c0_g1_i4:192-2921(+)